MKTIAINGSPRKQWNTAMLLNKALEGAASKGAEIELIHLYDLHYTGCTSCFSCKLKGGKSYGKCAAKDELTPVLERIAASDALILGSPIYFGQVTGMMRSFLERLLFQYIVYDADRSVLFSKRIPTGFVYTMNAPEERLRGSMEQQLQGTQRTLERVFGSCEALYSTDTYQFDDYSKYESSSFNEQEKAKRRREIFPLDCQKAFDMGANFVK